jgi:ATP-dependent Lon protease
VCSSDLLDKAVYGHNKAKKQIERIIGQWINGKQDGYCFGFEGPPGTGKTSLAKKGLSANSSSTKCVFQSLDNISDREVFPEPILPSITRY